MSQCQLTVAQKCNFREANHSQIYEGLPITSLIAGPEHFRAEITSWNTNFALEMNGQFSKSRTCFCYLFIAKTFCGTSHRFHLDKQYQKLVSFVIVIFQQLKICFLRSHLNFYMFQVLSHFLINLYLLDSNEKTHKIMRVMSKIYLHKLRKIHQKREIQKQGDLLSIFQIKRHRA